MTYKKKLIEVALPLEAINEASAREKSIRHGHPSTLHLWWARRPLATARAVIWASLVDDPSSLPEQFPTEEEQKKERLRLFAILERLVKWENTNNQEVLEEAKAEIMKSTGGNPPPLLDPFAGGGSIPLEAQRLGLKVYASDLNPVAVLINKAMIEIPPKFAGQPPINPKAKSLLQKEWLGAAGLAEDVRYYGEWMREEAYKRIGHLYPKVKDEYGKEHTVIAWIWTRTVKCPNPACGCEIPLVKSFNISQREGNKVSVKPVVKEKKVIFQVQSGKVDVLESTVGKKINGARCINCFQPVGFDYLREEAQAKRMGITLMAISINDRGLKKFISPNNEQISVAEINTVIEMPKAALPNKGLGISVQQYGMLDFSDLFTKRQSHMLTQFSNLLTEVELQVIKDGGSKSYTQAIVTYLAFVIDRLANYGSSLCLWDNRSGTTVQTFCRQALPIVWSFAESNPFSNMNLAGSWKNATKVVSNALENLPASFEMEGSASQSDAKNLDFPGDLMISTDPPYYDNIGYADLSDFFYMWLRRNLKSIYPEIFNTFLTPKDDELIANPFRFSGGKNEARLFFENGMFLAFQQMNKKSTDDIPVTVYYAFKQSGSDSNIASTGWETMLSGLIKAGFVIVGTWPITTENSGGLRVNNRNALASSIILVCRKRPVDAPIVTRRDFINSLKRELKPSLAKLQQSNIAPVDLAQSAIGPGMGVYSRFSKVLEADGNPMNVRSALQLINQELDLYFTEQDSELDRDSHFCVDLYTQYNFNDVKFGEADVLARAKNTSVEKLASYGILYAQKGIVRLLTREEIPDYDRKSERITWLLTQQLAHALEKEGINGPAKIISNILTSEPEHAKSLAYRLFQIAERKGWAKEAYAYNSLIIAWPEIQSRAADISAKSQKVVQKSLFNN